MSKNITSTLALWGYAFIRTAFLTRCNSGTGTKDSYLLAILANCFTCHKAKSFSRLHASPLYLSHIFQGFLLKEFRKTPSETNQLKTKDEERILQSLKQGN